ncbi:hypothetical protein BDK51DRAFT_31019 [Blyttiomyces helicus]|uniref:Uncharacterized protein n=1 Tax=Blyttiomyces helicus TaxID=388810 RepID=A0A4P9WPY8_9FUNG|nr:hypothetical protein BDK51DRAFT_31019 [Blyttiomyces helicus]|eukprot:RKO94622.1 hypothetical protein BDK51DRAFT_31019 [Blyttiomyces helicus]
MHPEQQSGDRIGIAVGHVYHLREDGYPTREGGSGVRVLGAPWFIRVLAGRDQSDPTLPEGVGLLSVDEVDGGGRGGEGHGGCGGSIVGGDMPPNGAGARSDVPPGERAELPSSGPGEEVHPAQPVIAGEGGVHY